MRSADNAEIELLGQRLVLVRAFKIMVEATEEIVLANDRIARLLDPGQIAVFDDRIAGRLEYGITDVKQELRRANALKLSYAASKSMGY